MAARNKNSFDHALDYLKGWPNVPGAVDFAAQLSPNVTLDPVYGGSCVHLNSDGQFEMGAVGYQMPIFLINGSNELDVSNDGGNDWEAISPIGMMSGLTAAGSFELETTEVYKADGVDYTPNMPLHAPTETQVNGADKSKAGKLFKTTAYAASDVAFTPGTQAISAVVSRRAKYNHHRRYVVSFWPVYVPGTA